MAKASAIDITGPTSFLFKSPWGFGKTLAAASFALGGPTYLAYWDKKKPVELITFFRKFGDKGKRVLDNLEYDVYDASNANQYLNKVVDFSGSCRLFAFITDSVTTMTGSAVGWSLGFNEKGRKVARKNENPQQIIPHFDEYKTETGLVSQSLDLCRNLPCHIIWTAHPIPGISIEGSGSSMKITKVNALVTYGNKVAGIVPGQFTEIYHFAKSTDYSTNPIMIRYKAITEQVGDEFAKTALGLPRELDFTQKLFFEVWLEALQQIEEIYKTTEVKSDLTQPSEPTVFNPFSQAQENKTWNPNKGAYE